MTDELANKKPVASAKRSPKEIAARGGEAGLGIVVTSAPGMTEAELCGAETEEEAVIVTELMRGLET